MNLKQLETFVRVVDAGGFSRAAASGALSQSTLSRQIAQLERDVGQRLLRRTGRGTHVTDAGAAVHAHAKAILELADRLRADLHELDASPAGHVTVGLPPRVAYALSASLVQRFRARFPRAVISVVEGLSMHLREWLIEGRVDVALLFDAPASPQIALETLMRESLVLVAAMGAQRLPARVRIAALAGYPLVLPSAPNAIRALVDAAVRPRGIALDVVAEVGAVNTALALVAHGVGASILPESAVAAGARLGSFQVAAIGPPAIRNRLLLATPRARPATRLQREAAMLLRELDYGALGLA